MFYKDDGENSNIENTGIYAATKVNQLLFLFKIQIIPLILTNVDIYDFPLNLSNEIMACVQWWGIVWIYSCGGKQGQKSKKWPNGDY